MKIEGVRPEDGFSNGNELQAFIEQLAAQTGCDRTLPENWLEAFIRLNNMIEDGQKTVVLLDEVSWMGYYDPMFANTVRIAWENYWKAHDRLIVVLCGSVSSWIKENLIDNSSYMGRRSLDLVVGELPLRECIKFWGRAAERVNSREIIDVLSVTGGVPRYLEEVNPALSLLKAFCQLRDTARPVDEVLQDPGRENRLMREYVREHLVEVRPEYAVGQKAHLPDVHLFPFFQNR